ncbi:MAG: dTDP-glucose 4,6-dehydratase [Spirochaetes bacterium]|jgi:dTDP-glucose 4,6-dehydratase|nr:dTDP-glucose 4,6-dehydratase [Spirochaetota bacterium]
MSRSLQSVLVTGGSGFIGANFIRYLFEQPSFTGQVVNLDALTYAGNPANLADLADAYGGSRYHFKRGDIRDFETLADIFSRYEIDTVVHFAAESHVDRSILGPRVFIETNVLGTSNLLEAARAAWKDRADVLFHHVSTDEVFGSLGEAGFFSEETLYDPKSPYSASKAGSDHLVRSWAHTYGLPATISNCTNNYGPYQFPEKMIPIMILNILEGKPLPVYGDGKNIRDWLYVTDHAEAIWMIMNAGGAGETYLVGGENEWENLTLVETLCDKVAAAAGRPASKARELITFVSDRPGHDRRYAVDCRKVKNELGWAQRHSFSEGLDATIRWYMENTEWVEQVRSGEYQKWIEDNYGRR